MQNAANAAARFMTNSQTQTLILTENLRAFIVKIVGLGWDFSGSRKIWKSRKIRNFKKSAVSIHQENSKSRKNPNPDNPI